MEKRKLFSSSPVNASKGKPRRKLFSAPTVTQVCRDCGERIITADETTTQYCPRCGGKRFDIPAKVKESEPTNISSSKIRRSLFSSSKKSSEVDNVRYFSDPIEGTVEWNLREFAGKEITQGQADKFFSEIDLEREGLATRCENGNLKVFSLADEVERLFSSLKITIIKELELDPPVGPIPEVIEGLKEEHPEIGPKTLVIMKKAHCLPKENLFSETEAWIADSGIRQDLKDEFEGKDFKKEDVERVLEERYPDAPEGTYEVLKELGVFEEGPDEILHIKN